MTILRERVLNKKWTEKLASEKSEKVQKRVRERQRVRESKARVREQSGESKWREKMRS